MKLIWGAIIFTLFISCAEESSDGGDVSFDRGQLGSLSTSSDVHNEGEVPYKIPRSIIVEFSNNGVLTARNIQPREDLEENPVFYYSGDEGEYPGELGTCGTTLAPGQTCTIEFTFFTDEVGNFVKEFYYDYHDGENKTYKKITLTAKAGEPAKLEFLDSASGLFDLGGQDVTGAAKTKKITVRNAGNLTAKDIIPNLAGKTAEDNLVYNWLGGSYPGTGGTCGTELAGGEECDVFVTYLALEKDKTYRGYVQFAFKDPVEQNSDSALLKVLGIDDRAFLTVTPAEQYIPTTVVNTSSNIQLTWRFANVGSRTASAINFESFAKGSGADNFYFDNADISLELVSTNCAATIDPNGFCDATYRLKPNFPADRNFPVNLTEMNYGQRLTYNDGKNVDPQINEDSLTYGVILGQALLTLQRDSSAEKVIAEGDNWGASNDDWAHVYGDPDDKIREIKFINGLTSIGRVNATAINVSITPNDGLLRFDALPSELASGEEFIRGINYISNLDDTTYPYTDATNKIREYDIKVTYNNQVSNQEINFKISAKDDVRPVIKFFRVTQIPDDPNTVEDETETIETEINETVNNSDNASASGSPEMIRESFAYTGYEAQSKSIRIYNFGFTPITPSITKVAGADDSYFDFEKVGTTCDNPIADNQYCEIKLKFQKDTIVDEGDLVNVGTDLGDGRGEIFTTNFKISDDYDVTVDSTPYTFNKELELSFEVAHRKKGELILNTEHNPDNRATTDPSYNIYEDYDFAGDFLIVDGLYENETSKVVEGDAYTLHFDKKFHGEINNMQCNIEGTDATYFACTVEPISTDSQPFYDYLEAIGKTGIDLKPYNYREHVKYTVKTSFTVDGTSTERVYNAKAVISYHGKVEASTDPYVDPDDKFEVDLTAEVKGEPNFIFNYAEADLPLDIGTFKIEENLADIAINIKNIGGNSASAVDGNVTLSYPADMFDFVSMDASDPKCNYLSEDSVAGTVTFNADALGVCVLNLKPTLLGPLKDTDGENRLLLSMSFNNSYEAKSTQMELTATQTAPFLVNIEGADFPLDPIMTVPDIKIGEKITQTVVIKTQLGKDSQLIEQGAGSPFLIDINQYGTATQWYISMADDDANCDFSSNPTMTSPATSLSLVAKADAECTIQVTVEGKIFEKIRSTPVVQQGTDSQGNEFTNILEPSTAEFIIDYPTSVYEGLNQQINFDDEIVEFVRPYNFAIDGVDVVEDINRYTFDLELPDQIELGETITKTITIKSNLEIDSDKVNDDTGLPFKFALTHTYGHTAAAITRAVSDANCSFSANPSVGSPVDSVTLHAKANSSCDFDITFTGKDPRGSVTKTETTIDGVDVIVLQQQNLAMLFDYDPIDYTKGFPARFRVNEEDNLQVRNPFAITGGFNFPAMFLGDSHEYTFTLDNDAMVATDGSRDYFQGPITLDFTDSLDAVGSATIESVTTTGCTIVSETKKVITFNTDVAGADCQFKLKVRQGSYADPALSNLSVMNLEAKWDDWSARLGGSAGRMLESFDMLPNLSTNADSGLIEYDMGKDVIGEQLTYDFNVTSLSSYDTTTIYAAGSDSVLIEPMRIYVTDAANYEIDWTGGSPNSGCSEVSNSGTVIEFHSDAGAACNFTLTFNVPAVGKRPNEVIVTHVGHIQDRQSIWGSGLNYADIDPDSGTDNPVSIGQAIGGSTTSQRVFTMANIETEAANGLIEEGLTLVDCAAPAAEDINPGFLDEDGNFIAEGDSSAFSISGNTCAQGLQLADDSEAPCGFNIDFTPVKVDVVYHACLKYTYRRYPTEPRLDDNMQVNWITHEIPIYAYSQAPDLMWTGWQTVEADGDGSVSLAWADMTIVGGTAESYNIERKGGVDSDFVVIEQNTTNLSLTDTPVPGFHYTYKITANVKYNYEDPTDPTRKKAPDNIAANTVNVTYPNPGSIFIYKMNGGSSVVVEKDLSSASSQPAAAAACSAKNIDGTNMSLISGADFTALDGTGMVNDLVGSWEYIDHAANLSSSFTAFDQDSLSQVGNATGVTLALVVAGTTATCKLDRISNPDNPVLIRYGMAGGSIDQSTGLPTFGLEPTANTFFYCYPEYPWIALAGEYPEAGARCIARVP